MNYCLHMQQTPEYLKQAYEISMLYKDIDKILDILEYNPNVSFLIDCTAHDDLDWTVIKRYSDMVQEKLCLKFDTIWNCERAKSEGIKYCHSKSATSSYEFNALINYGVSYIYLDAPLFFDLPLINKLRKESDVKVRFIANLANKTGIPMKDGVCGSWIRPEDLPAYEKYIDVIEFVRPIGVEIDEFVARERALFRVYNEGEWPGELGLLISDLNYPATNRMIDSDICSRRINCGQRCQDGGKCTICYNMLNLADEKKLAEYKTEVLDKA